ncbi:hypothetical protein [Streptomyces azureus]
MTRHSDEQIAAFRNRPLGQLPSAYAEPDDYADPFTVAGREEQLRPQLELVHAERIARAATHLVTVVEQVAAAGFADKRFAGESLREARRSYELWQRCLAESRRDLSQEGDSHSTGDLESSPEQRMVQRTILW